MQFRLPSAMSERKRTQREEEREGSEEIAVARTDVVPSVPVRRSNPDSRRIHGKNRLLVLGCGAFVIWLLSTIIWFGQVDFPFIGRREPPLVLANSRAMPGDVARLADGVRSGIRDVDALRECSGRKRLGDLYRLDRESVHRAQRMKFLSASESGMVPSPIEKLSSWAGVLENSDELLSELEKQDGDGGWKKSCSTSPRVEVEIESPTPFLLVGRNMLVAPFGDVFDCENAVMERFCCPLLDKQKIDEERAQVAVRTLRGADRWRVDETVYSISQYWGSAVFHMFIECIPRLMIYFEELVRDPSIKIHVAPDGNKLGAEWLQFLGIHPDRLIASNSPFIASHLIYPSRLGCGSTNPRLVRKLRNVTMERLRLYYPVAKNAEMVGRWEFDGHPRILIIERMKDRRVPMIAEIVEALRERYADGNVTVFSERNPLSLPDALRIFNEHSIIVGPHGAAFSNLVACRPGTRVIEFLARNPINMCFHDLSNKLGLHYYAFLPEVSDSQGMVDVTVGDALRIVERARTDALEDPLIL